MLKDMVAGRMAGSISDSERARDAADLLATHEIEQLEAAAELADAADLPHNIEPPNREHRQEALLSIIEAVLAGEFKAFWRKEIAGTALDREPPESLIGIGADSDRWESQVSDWAESVREQGAHGPDREMANRACQEVYGVELGDFERMVVEWDRNEAVRELVAGNVTASTRVMRDAAEEIRE